MILLIDKSKVCVRVSFVPRFIPAGRLPSERCAVEVTVRKHGSLDRSIYDPTLSVIH